MQHFIECTDPCDEHEENVGLSLTLASFLSMDACLHKKIRLRTIIVQLNQHFFAKPTKISLQRKEKNNK